MVSKQPPDLQNLVEIWAKDFFMRKANRKENKLIEQELVSMDVDWKRVLFSHEPPEYDPEPPKPGSGVPTSNCLFHTTYTNKTSNPQTYNFSAERSTRSACTVEIEECFTKGFEMSVTLKTPCEIFEANAGFSREHELTNVSGETTEEELTWGVNSDIKVNPGSRAEAKMIVTEEEYDGKFKVKTHAVGLVRVTFTNLKDNNAYIRTVEGSIADIVQWAKDKRMLQTDAIIIDKETKSVVCTTSGKCRFKYGLKQDVEVDQYEI